MVKANKNNVMWFEPSQVPDFLPIGPEGVVFDVGFHNPPGGHNGSANHVLNDHSYCCQMATDICPATGEPQAKDAERCLRWHEKKIGRHADNAKSMGIPFFLSEFGACLDTDECVTEIT